MLGKGLGGGDGMEWGKDRRGMGEGQGGYG